MSKPMSDLDLVATGLAARRDAARADYERLLAKHRGHVAAACAAEDKQPLWRKAWAPHVEAERKWRRLAEFAEMMGAPAEA